MEVPVLVKNFSYVVPDDDMDATSDVLTEQGLPLSPTSAFRTRCEGEFHTKGRFHRITHSTLECSVQHFVLYPVSFSSLNWSEVAQQPPYHIKPSSRCPYIFVPRPSAVYASLIRMMLIRGTVQPAQISSQIFQNSSATTFWVSKMIM